VALCLGVVASETLGLPAAPSALVALALATVALGLGLRAGRATDGRRRLRLRLLGLTLAAMATIAGAAASYRRMLGDDAVPAAASGRFRPRLRFQGRIAEAPEHLPGRTHLIVDVVARPLEDPGGDGAPAAVAPWTGRVRLTLPAPRERLMRGDHVRWIGRLRAVDGPANPGVFDVVRRLRSRGIAALARVEDPEALALLGTPPDPGLLGRLARPIEAHAASAVQFIAAQLGPRARAITCAVVIGDRRFLLPALERAFARSGAIHVLSVSGLHLALVTLAVLALLELLLRRWTWLTARHPSGSAAALGALPAAWAYTVYTGSATATVRAALMATFGLVALALLRRARLSGALALSLCGVAMVLPATLFEPSCQLSFAAVLAVAAAMRWLPSIEARLSTADPASAAPARLAPLPTRVLRQIRRYALGLILGSWGANLVTAPLVAAHFGELPTVGVVGNLVVVPLCELVVLPLGLLAALLHGLNPEVARPLAMGAGLAAEWSGRIAEALAARPYAAVELPQPAVWVALLMGGLGLLTLSFRRTVRRAAWVALLIAVALVAWTDHRERHGRLRAVVLDVGQGDAILLRTPGGEDVLVDGGGALFEPDAPNPDDDPTGSAAAALAAPGEAVLLPALRALGVRRLSWVIVSHPHPDHVGGLATVLERLPVGAVVAADAPWEHPAAQRLLQVARRRGVRLLLPGRHLPRQVLHGGARFEFLAPGSSGPTRAPLERSTNDGSLVVRVSLAAGGPRLLLTGDIERLAEQDLARGAASVSADVLKVPHHGSRTSSTEALLARVAPRLAVVSCGRGNRFGFPHAEVAERYRHAGIPLLGTHTDGAVRIDVLPDAVVARGHRSGRIVRFRWRSK
jgi:competence protein ComEC